MKRNLEPIQRSAPLWLGSGFHYALEDYHTVKQWPTGREALTQYARATKSVRKVILPDDWKEQLELGCQMLDHYEDWLTTREPLETFVWRGVPQAEAYFEIPLPIKGPNGEDVVYSGTLDRVIIDEHDRLWIVEYKTAKVFQLAHFETDDQCTSYCWGSRILYPGYEIAGVIYQQHKKAIPDEPLFLQAGRFSTNKTQATTWHLYKKALENLYGNINKAPGQNIEFLNMLAAKETPEQGPFVRRDWVYRNEHSIEAQGVKILLELEDMLNPNLPLYPNPTRDCSWDCSFLDLCIMLDDGSEWEYLLDELMMQRVKGDSSWRNHMPNLEKTEILTLRGSQPSMPLQLQ